MATKITSDVLESYLHCKFKGHLKLAGQQGTKCDFEAMLTELRAEVRLKAIDAILARHPGDQVARNIPLTTAGLKEGPQYILDGTLEDDTLALHFDGLKRVAGQSRLGDFHYLPVLFHEGRQIKKEQKLLLDVYGMILSGLQGRTPAYGVIWHGRECKATKVKLNPNQRQAEQVLHGLKDMTTLASPPRLLLNEHCQVCEFRQECREQAVQGDNLTLLRGMGEKEVNRYARKGISTVTQLSCTFRLRKRGKRVKTQPRPHYFALQALAVREKKIYVLGTPKLPESPVRMYLDCEGDPERGFVYLIGLTIVGAGEDRHYSFWADSEADEPSIFKQFLDTVARHASFTLFYYGSYERAFLRRMRKVGGRKLVDHVLTNSCNIVSIIHASIYFPTYSNGLKDVGGYLGCTWSDDNASGAQSVAWRRAWEADGGDAFKHKLITYNTEDCIALQRVTECIDEIVEGTGEGRSQAGDPAKPPKVARAEDIPALTSPREYSRKQFALPEFAYINRCAYFDYQREKIFLRTNKTLRQLQAQKQKERKRKLRVNRRIVIRSVRCRFCKGTQITRDDGDLRVKLVYDLTITSGGIKRQLIECVAAQYRCLGCNRTFLPRRYTRTDRYGHSLKRWAMWLHMVHRISFERLEDLFQDCFGLRITYRELYMFKSVLARYYRGTYKRILMKIVAGKLIHADETHVNLQQGKGYVWVLANMEEVYFLYKSTREGDFLHKLLKDFHGVLVSDFFGAYESLPCEQQKCLVHLVRDMNHDLLNSPFDDEFKSLVGEFGELLRTIVATIDQYGLKKRHLNKHLRDVNSFFRTLTGRDFRSELAQSYQLRLIKNQGSLFTFLSHDSVPWNNNSAEHALKCYARYRRITDGQMTETGLSDYLVLLSVCQTCKYKGISFLSFLLSGEKDVDKFIASRWKTKRTTGLELYPQGFTSKYRKRKRGRKLRSKGHESGPSLKSPRG